MHNVGPGGAVLGAPPCIVGLPPAWRAAVSHGALWRAVWDRHGTQAPTPDGAGVLYQNDSGATANIEIIGRGHKVVERIGSIPNPNRQGLIGFNTITPGYGAFVWHPTNDEQSSFRWNLYLWNRQSRSMSLVAKNPVDAHGNPLKGGFVQPVLTADYLYWIQSLPDTSGWGASELMQYSLRAGTTRTLYRGLTTVFVPYGNQVLFNGIAAHAPRPTPTTLTGGPPMRIYAVDAATARSVPAPPGISAAADWPNTMAADGDLIVWATDQVVKAWRPSWGRSITLIPSSVDWPEGQRLGIAGPTYVRLYRNFLVWNPGNTYVLDLKTNSFAALDHGSASAGEDMSGSVLSMQDYTAPNSYNKTAHLYEFNQTLLDLQGLPDLPPCGR